MYEDAEKLLLIGIYKQAMIDAKYYLEKRNNPYMDFSRNEAYHAGIEAIEWVNTASGTFDLVADALDWTVEYLQRVSKEYLKWYEHGSVPRDQPDLYSVPEVVTRNHKLRETVGYTEREVECDWCQKLFTSKYVGGKWTSNCPDCVANKSRTYAATHRYFK